MSDKQTVLVTRKLPEAVEDRLTSDQASTIAGCQSIHRDISLDF